MKNSKKGISLIVLVITIIVIIILAAAVLLTLNNNNPINNSKTAVYENDKAEVRSALALYVSNFMANDYNHNGPFDADATDIHVGIYNEVDVTGNTAVMATEENRSTTTTTKVTWSDLGFTEAPKSIKTCSYNASTGVFTFTPIEGYTNN